MRLCCPVAKVNIQFQQISFSPGGCSALLPPSSLGTNVCTTFVAQERRGLPRPPPPAIHVPRVSRPVQVGKCYKVERNEESATILCFTTAVPSVRARMEVLLYFYHARSTHSDQAGRHTSTTYAAGHGHRIVSCYCYNKGEPDCCLVFHLWHFRLYYLD